jgi:hypothetical protein
MLPTNSPEPFAEGVTADGLTAYLDEPGRPEGPVGLARLRELPIRRRPPTSPGVIKIIYH